MARWRCLQILQTGPDLPLLAQGRSPRWRGPTARTHPDQLCGSLSSSLRHPCLSQPVLRLLPRAHLLAPTQLLCLSRAITPVISVKGTSPPISGLSAHRTDFLSGQCTDSSIKFRELEIEQLSQQAYQRRPPLSYRPQGDGGLTSVVAC